MLILDNVWHVILRVKIVVIPKHVYHAISIWFYKDPNVKINVIVHTLRKMINVIHVKTSALLVLDLVWINAMVVWMDTLLMLKLV